MTSKSCLNISGCCSYLIDMYCFIASDNGRFVAFRNGRKSMLLFSFRLVPDFDGNMMVKGNPYLPGHDECQ